MRHLKENLLVQFSVISFVTMAGIAILLAVVLANKIQQDAIDAVVDEAIGASSERLHRVLTPTDLQVPMTGARYDRFHAFVQQSIVSARTARIKLWAKDGTVIYSTDQELVGTKFPARKPLLKALHGENVARIKIPTDTEGERERQLEPLIEVYTPIFLPGATEPQGVLELYHYYAPTEQRVNNLRGWVFGSVGIGFVVLYGGLVFTVWNGWRTINRQRAALAGAHADLRAANDTLERRVAERTADLAKSNAELAREITERQQVEAALQVSQARLAGILETAHDAIVSVDETQRIILFNQGAERIFGYRAEEVTGQSLDLLLPPRFVEAHRAHVQDFASSPTPSEAQQMGTQRPVVARRKDGTEFPVDASYSKLKMAGEQVFTAILRDISERKRAEAALQQTAAALDRAHSTLRSLLESLSDGLVMVDQDGRVQQCNRAAGVLLGLDKAQVLGQSCEMLIEHLVVHTTTPEVTRDLCREALTRGPEQVDIEATFPGSPPRTVHAQGFSVLDTAGDRLGWGLVLHDVTRERELAQLKDSLVSTVSHELRTPMTTVLGLTELLLTRPFPPARQRLFLETIHQDGQRLKNLIDDFLDLQRLAAGHQVFRPEPVALGPLLHDVVSPLRVTHPAHQLEERMPTDLPAVWADRDSVHEVLTNLVSNAIKYSPQGGRVVIQARDTEAEVVVTVQDEGLGLPPEAFSRLFERFYRVDNSDRREIGGTGLGLALVKELVEAQGGRVWAESAGLGQGSTFGFTLPLVAGAAEDHNHLPGQTEHTRKGEARHEEVVDCR